MTSIGRRSATHTLGADGERELRCEYCRARCTVGTDGRTEYGHMSGCPDRPDEWPRGGARVEDADHVDSRLVTDGGTFDCDGCSREVAVSKRRRYMPPEQSDVGPVQYDDLWPRCATGKPTEQLFRAAEDQEATG